VGLRLIPNLLTPSTQSEFVEKLKYSVTHEPSDVTEIVQWICKKSEYAEAVAEIMH
jgi:nitrogen regulatory protein PII